MRILITSLICFLATCLPGQCISVQVDSVFCLANGEYGILYDVEGTGDEGWVLDGYNVSGGYNTDEVLELTGLFGQTTVLVFRDSSGADCILEVLVQAPEGCGTTDPCFGLGLEIEALPGSCGQGIRVRVFPSDIGIFDSVLVINEVGDIVASGFTPDFPDFIDFNDLPPGNYTVTITINGSCTLAEDLIITGSDECGSISGLTWVDENESGVREGDEPVLNNVVVRLRDANDFSVLIAETTATPNGYFFGGVPDGQYVIQFDPPGSNTPTAFQAGGDPTVDNDMNEDFVTETITVAEGDNIQNVDGGFLPAQCSVVTISDDVSCGGGIDGSVSAIATGQAPFTYQWSTGNTTQDIFGLPAGFYSVTVTDATGCTTINSINIGEPTELVIEFEEFGDVCDPNGNNLLNAFVKIGRAHV